MAPVPVVIAVASMVGLNWGHTVTTSSARTRPAASVLLALLSVCTLVFAAAVALVVSGGTARADSAPASGTPATVTADALPTVQINGVVWSQVTVGNTVYATGNFTSARPAGSPLGSNETPRSNLLAYDITTGNLITSFNHSLNSQGKVITASPDGSTIYVGGTFSKVDGIAHAHIAAFNATTGALINAFAPQTDGTVAAIAATNSTVYFGGTFGNVNGNSRTDLAAAAAGTGALLGWAPTADDNAVNAMVIAPDGSRVIVGGSFGTLNGTPAYGLGALDANTGATLPFAANASIQDYLPQDPSTNTGAAILSLTTDGTEIYGSGYTYGVGNFEGTFSAVPDSGAINVVNDCHGDTYSTFVAAQVLYSVGHPHDCSAIGAFPDSLNPRMYHRAMAESTFATGTNVGPDDYGWNYNGVPDSTLLDWFPTLAQGTFTGQGQAAWSVTGNSSYVALGGEFPTVNSGAQQGLVRFAVSNNAPNAVGPRPSANLTPHATSPVAGSIQLTWQGTYDYDNQALTYKLVRDSHTATPIYTTTVNSTFWQIPQLSYTDTGLTAGSLHSYRVYVYDAFGNAMSGSTITATATPSVSAYANDVLTAGASDYWRLGESSGSTAADTAGYNPLTEQSGVTDGTSGAINGDNNTAATFNGTSTGAAVETTQFPDPATYTAQAWFKTTTRSGGEILGFGNDATLVNSNPAPACGQNTVCSSNYDRMVYMTNGGQLAFGTNDNGIQMLTTPSAYNDGQWHQVVYSMSAAGTALYVDGVRIGTNPNVTAGQHYYGYWHVGGDNLANWPAAPSSYFFQGSIDEAAIYPTALSYAQVQRQFTDSGRTLSVPAVPTDSYGQAVMANSPGIYWRLDDAAGSPATDTSGNGATGGYSGGVTYRVASPVSGTTGTAVTLDGSSGAISARTAMASSAVYSEELWFRTTSASGGELIGSGLQATGLSQGSNRVVYMLNSGQLSFGTWNNGFSNATSPKAYKDGKWHQVVATEGSDGMHLYVDGQPVATNPASGMVNYSGYWRVGGDQLSGWPNQPSSNYFAGTVDEVSVYPYELSAADVTAQYQSSPAAVPPNKPPVAAFTASCTALTCAFNASASYDPDGTVVSYSWNFGDGSAAGTGSTASHAYPAAGDYPVTLTVTDNSGATSTKTATVSPRPPANPAPTVLASDGFGRTVSGGLGTADVGGAWTSAGVAANLSVSGGVATFALPTAPTQIGAALRSVSASSDESDVTWSSNVPATGGGIYLYLVGRRVGTNQEYDARVHLLANRTVGLSITKLNGSTTSTVIAPEVIVPGLAYTPGTALTVRFQALGTSPTTLQAMVWPASGTQPASWQVSTTDSSAGLQAAGGVGLTAYLSATATNAPVAIGASNFGVFVPRAPSAAFTPSCSGQSCTVDGTASTDPAGSSLTYQWSWGDGVVTTGATSSHAFAAPGTYRITLTVTDSSGLTSVATASVTVPA